ncbi:hypothetical protein MOVS_01435 [Moraxella ovis]|uniref:Uncharacterized protein n=1 Tax=Moraxella ovis TaxID=29433 RepID=A0A378PHR2_9GAMM|nr:hypothetical protein [Moraxella ovis]ANB90875.1 hypothetical protein MOVS_01435 [Moraxella ovis]STY86321.1 Uncharacterised protein [Moraxella ovis]
MIAGLRVWDRQGREISNITGRYPKFIGSGIITTAEKASINYTIPQGTTRIAVPVYLSRNDTLLVPPDAKDVDENYRYTNNYNLWSVDIKHTNTGFEYDTTHTDNANKQKPPIKIYWGYV